MGNRGPIPNRSDALVGHPQAAGGHAAGKTKAPAAKRRPNWHAADPDWHSTARQWYASLRASGQAQFYEASDIAFCYFVAEELSDYKLGNKGGAMYFSALLSAMSACLSTEADRRRAGIELTQDMPDESKDNASVIEQYKAILAGPNAAPAARATAH